MANAPLDDWLPYINTCLLSVISVGGGFAFRALGEMRDKLGKVGDRVTKLETNFGGHEEWCAEQRARNDREHGEIRESVETTRKSVHELRNEAFKIALRDRIRED